MSQTYGRIISKEIKEFVDRTKLGFIATVCPDGTPNLSPKGTTIAWDDHHLAFADIHSPAYFIPLSEEDIRNWWIQYWDQINKPK